jgi:hypothetical protein
MLSYGCAYANNLMNTMTPYSANVYNSVVFVQFLVHRLDICNLVAQGMFHFPEFNALCLCNIPGAALISKILCSRLILVLFPAAAPYVSDKSGINQIAQLPD